MSMMKRLSALFKQPAKAPAYYTHDGSTQYYLKQLLNDGYELTEVSAARRMTVMGKWVTGQTISRELRRMRQRGLARVKYQRLQNGREQAVYMRP